MRIAIFDGILETHVGDSLERAFIRRGHDVLNTGKVGSGFEFPPPGADLSHLEHAISRVVAHRPDWVIVMRPASLPPALLRRLKASGAGLAVWLSDDPVLLHLSYGPMLESYDLVLHCGTAKVLSHYEELFGRPTGVNFPFWTDHEAFPKVWGLEESESTAMFLGNMHDQVRRKRYFALGGMNTDVRVHGSVGTDYLNLGGGYLDSDAEVVNAGARAKVALNIPQFFADHRGLPTWFEGLDQLGFFEYPSRIIQYLAMGLPVISIIPGTPEFASLPEMIVVDDVQAADAAIGALLQGDIAGVSRASEDRFARHFSADARVLAFESLVRDDSWRGLDAVERNLWFTQFDGTTAADEGTPTAPRERVEAGGGNVTAGRVLVLGREVDRATSRPAVTARALRRLGAEVDLVDVVDAAAIGERAAELDGVVVCGADLAALVPDGLPQTAWRILVDETSRKVAQVMPLLASFDAIGVRDANLHAQLAAAGHTRVVACPPAVDAEYLDLLGQATEVAAVVQTHASPETDTRFAPALTTDVIDGDIRRQKYSELWGMGLPELASRCRCRVGLVGFVGTPADPVIDEITPFAAAAADVVIVPRVTPSIRVAPYPELGLQVRDSGELTVKLRRLAASPMLRETAAGCEVREVLGAEEIWARLLPMASRAAEDRESPSLFPHGPVRRGMESQPIGVDMKAGQFQTALDVRLVPAMADHSRYTFQLLESGNVVHEEVGVPRLRCVVLAAPGRRLGPLAVRLRYDGPDAIHPAEDLASVEVSSEPFVEIASAQGGRGAHTTVWNRP